MFNMPIFGSELLIHFQLVKKKEKEKEAWLQLP
jgi:hypothetical protein